jgi:hypothetical protein
MHDMLIHIGAYQDCHTYNLAYMMTNLRGLGCIVCLKVLLFEERLNDVSHFMVVKPFFQLKVIKTIQFVRCQPCLLSHFKVTWHRGPSLFLRGRVCKLHHSGDGLKYQHHRLGACVCCCCWMFLQEAKYVIYNII